MADENIMSLIKNLFIEDNNYINSSQNLDGLNDKYINFNKKNINTSLTIDNLCNTKKNIHKQQNSCQNTNQNNALIYSQQSQPSTTLSSVSINKISTPNDSFFNVLINNSFLSTLAMKENDLNFKDDLLYNKNYLLNGNQNQSQIKSNYDLTANSKIGINNISSTNENINNSLKIIKDSSIPPISNCSIKTLLTPIINRSNNFNNYGQINNTNNILHQNNNPIVSSPLNLLTNLSQTSNSSTLSSNPFGDLILGADDNLKFNYGLNISTMKSQDDQKQNQILSQQNSFNFDTNSSPDSFIYTEEDRFESQIRSLANEVNSTIQLHMNGLHMRREGLLQQLEHIKKIYIDVLRKKKMALNGNKNFFKDSCFIDQKNKQLEKFVLPSITFTKPESTLYKSISTLGFLNTPAFGPFCTASGDGFEFTIPGINSKFTIETRNCFNDELLVGREKINIEIIALFNENNFIEINGNNSLDSQSNSSLNNKSSTPSSKKNALLEYNSKSVIPHTFFDHNNGKYTVTYNVPLLQNIPPELIIKINVNGLPINDSPIRVPVQIQKKQNWKCVTTFGTEGNEIGQLCRPWGVAIVKMPLQLLMNFRNNNITFGNGETTKNEISSETNNLNSSNITNQIDHHYLIGIADRSNNRIQLLDYDSKTHQIKVLNVFGSGPNTRPGTFDRPAGICINLSLGHIIVADKDNHRIQVFSLTGRYLFKFGEKGNRIGQFYYPWDIDSCKHSHQIIVSDTRNRRIQLFTSYGQYINHFSHLLDSPRGVAFLPDKRILVSDFNKHRILIFEKFTNNSNLNFKDNATSNSSTNDNILISPKIIGFSEGSAWGEFLRPQGITVSGNVIFCADSRNNRICVYNICTQTFEYLSEDLGLDRPSDLAVIDENLLVVIDFGNNRLQILQR